MAKWGDPSSLTSIMNRSTGSGSTTVTFMSNAPAASTYAAPTPKVPANATGANAGRESLPLAPSGVPQKAPHVIAKAKVVFKPAPADLQAPRPNAPPVGVSRPPTPAVPASAPAAPAFPATNAPAVDANKELIGKLRAEREALLGANTCLVARLSDTQYDLEEASRRAYHAERQLDELQVRRSRSRRRRSSSSPRHRRRREELRRDDQDRRDDRYEPRRDDRYRTRRDPRDTDREDYLRMDSRSRVGERSTRAESSSHALRGTAFAEGESEVTLASPPPPAYPPPPNEPHSHLNLQQRPQVRPTFGGTSTQPHVRVYDMVDEEWDAPGPSGQRGGAAGFINTGGGFGDRTPPEPPKARPSVRPSSNGGGKGSDDDYPDRAYPHRPLTGPRGAGLLCGLDNLDSSGVERVPPFVPATTASGRVIPIDAEMRSVEIAGIDRTGDTGVGWNRSIDFGRFQGHDRDV